MRFLKGEPLRNAERKCSHIVVAGFSQCFCVELEAVVSPSVPLPGIDAERVA